MMPADSQALRGPGVTQGGMVRLSGSLFEPVCCQADVLPRSSQNTCHTHVQVGRQQAGCQWPGKGACLEAHSMGALLGTQSMCALQGAQSMGAFQDTQPVNGHLTRRPLQGGLQGAHTMGTLQGTC